MDLDCIVDFWEFEKTSTTRVKVSGFWLHEEGKKVIYILFLLLLHYDFM